MPHTRLPRFKRSTAISPIHLTERDQVIVRLVSRHRFLTSQQIVSLLGENSQPVLRRLQRLYHHGYLERPRAQLDYYHRGGSHPIVYGLGNKSLKLLMGRGSRRWGEKNRAVGRVFLEHAVMVSQIMVSIELACWANGRVRFLPREELASSYYVGGSLRWRVRLDRQVKLGVVPDAVFGLEFSHENGRRERAFFFIEADRGTMPIVRRSLSQTSLHRKLLAYEATWSQSLHRSLFGFHRFRTLFVTQSASRLELLRNVAASLKSGHGLFLFADRTILERSGAVLGNVWKTSVRDQNTNLLS